MSVQFNPDQNRSHESCDTDPRSTSAFAIGRNFVHSKELATRPNIKWAEKTVPSFLPRRRVTMYKIFFAFRHNPTSSHNRCVKRNPRSFSGRRTLAQYPCKRFDVTCDTGLVLTWNDDVPNV